MRATISAGVPTGAKKPPHRLKLNPGMPSSATVGVSAALPARSVVVTASRRTLPPFTCGVTPGRPRK